MEERYGRRRRGFTSFAVVMLLLLTGFVIWSGWHYATTPIRTQVISFTPTAKGMLVRYELTRRDSQMTVICRVAAQDYQRKVVGEIADEIGPGLSSLTRTVEVPTFTSAAAVFVGPCSGR